ncbi:MAG: site-specific integrase [Pleurocapsa minor GSE-CHR-MK-17-07R]|nr:site-specific integrase [Pleurocapsa minor GSE-CHR-MK 17-07R]
MTSLVPRPPAEISSASEPTYNFVMALPGRATSYHTQRAYFRWVDVYLADTADLKQTQGLNRLQRMSALPIRVLQRVLTAAQLRAWLGQLASQGHGKQGVSQARAAVVTLASLLSEAGWMDDYASAAMGNVRIPRAAEGQRTGRWLSSDELRQMIDSAQDMATSDNQRQRNAVIMLMLCTMALRREELAGARWDDLSLQNRRAVLRVRGKGKKTAIIDVPKPVMGALERWRSVMAREVRGFDASFPLVVRLWKGGRPSRQALTPEGIWLVIHESAQHAGLGMVAPHDLRRSVAGSLQESGVSVDVISRLLRHANVAVTERYLKKLPQRNEGAMLMSDVLGFGDDDDDDEISSFE